MLSMPVFDQKFLGCWFNWAYLGLFLSTFIGFDVPYKRPNVSFWHLGFQRSLCSFVYRVYTQKLCGIAKLNIVFSWWVLECWSLSWPKIPCKTLQVEIGWNLKRLFSHDSGRSLPSFAEPFTRSTGRRDWLEPCWVALLPDSAKRSETGGERGMGQGACHPGLQLLLFRMDWMTSKITWFPPKQVGVIEFNHQTIS